MVTFRLNGVARTVDADTDIPLLWVCATSCALFGALSKAWMDSGAVCPTR